MTSLTPQQQADAELCLNWAEQILGDIESNRLELADATAGDTKSMLARLPDDVQSELIGKIRVMISDRSPDVARIARALFFDGHGVPRRLPEADSTDDANAERFVKRYGHHFRYVAGWGWLFYDGRRWRVEDVGEVERAAIETARSIMDEAAFAYERQDVDSAKRLTKHAAKSLSANGIRNALLLANVNANIRATVAEFDSHPWLLNVRNGTLDLRRGELRQHCQADHITKVADVDFDPAAECPKWESFLTRIFNGNNNLIGFMPRAIGYSLTGLTTEQVLFLLIGVGANGKTTFQNVLRALLGGYSIQAEFSTFLKRSGDGPRNDIARLAGARLVAASEAGQGRQLDETVVKQLTGGDVVTARKLYREEFEFVPQFKLWMAANHKPRIEETADAIWRRIQLIPFDVVIPPAERDPQLTEKLIGELPGILAWAVRGCLEWQQGGLKPPPEVTTATNAYRAEQDAFAAFLTDCCVIGPQLWARSGELHDAYRRWGGQDNAQGFGVKLREHGFVSDKATGGIRIWRGLGLSAKDDT